MVDSNYSFTPKIAMLLLQQVDIQFECMNVLALANPSHSVFVET